jgi:hypothetical protein
MSEVCFVQSYKTFREVALITVVTLVDRVLFLFWVLMAVVEMDLELSNYKTNTALNI